MQRLSMLLRRLRRLPNRWLLRRLERKRTVFEITREAYHVILESEDSGHYEPIGCYWFRENRKFIGIDNSRGLAFVEEFTSKKQCISWLLGELEMSDLIVDDKQDEKLLWTVIWLENGADRHERMEEHDAACRVRSLIESGIEKKDILAVAPRRLWNPQKFLRTEKPIQVGDMVFEFRATREENGKVSATCTEAARITDIGDLVAILEGFSDPGLTYLYLEHLNMFFHADDISVWGYATGQNQAERFTAQAAAWILAGRAPETSENVPYPWTA